MDEQLLGRVVVVMIVLVLVLALALGLALALTLLLLPQGNSGSAPPSRRQHPRRGFVELVAGGCRRANGFRLA